LENVIQRLKDASGAVVRCAGQSIFENLATSGIYLLTLEIAPGILGGVNSVYVGQTSQDFALRFYQHANSTTSGAKDYISSRTIPLNKDFIAAVKNGGSWNGKPARQLFDAIEQRVIEAFEGKVRLGNKNAASANPIC
jgi:hypothetical protein